MRARCCCSIIVCALFLYGAYGVAIITVTVDGIAVFLVESHAHLISVVVAVERS